MKPTPVAAEAALFRELRLLCDACAEAGIDFLLLGGLALLAHLPRGARLTMDIDLAVRAEQVRRLREVLSGLGYSVGPQDLWQRARRSVGDTEVVIDFTSESVTSVQTFHSHELRVAEDGVAAEIIPFHPELSTLSCRVPVVRMEDFLILKLLAGRERDLLDVVAMLHRRGSDLDVSRFSDRVALSDLDIPVAGALGRLQAALESGELLTSWEERFGYPLQSAELTELLRRTQALVP